MTTKVTLLRGLRWRHITTVKELCCHDSLFVGQVFTWRQIPANWCTSGRHQLPPMDTGQQHSYVGVLGGTVFELREHGDLVMYRPLVPSPSCEGGNGEKGEEEEEGKECQEASLEVMHEKLADFLNINVKFENGIEKLEQLYGHFSRMDAHLFARIARHLPGIRVLRQDVFECLISFICSSNNNVARITLMIQRLCQKYGTYLGEIELTVDDKSLATDTDSPPKTLSFYSFPTLEQLSRATESDLRELGFGYRASYITSTVQQLSNLDRDYLDSMRAKHLTTETVLERLIQFKGVGYKVASCVALYSCDRHELVPIDVHMARLVRQHYSSRITEVESRKSRKSSKSSESMTPLKMKHYMGLFVEIFGSFAGWAHVILFGSQLGPFKSRIPLSVQKELSSKQITHTKKEKSEFNPAMEMKGEELPQRALRKRRKIG